MSTDNLELYIHRMVAIPTDKHLRKRAVELIACNVNYNCTSLQPCMGLVV